MHNRTSLPDTQSHTLKTHAQSETHSHTSAGPYKHTQQTHPSIHKHTATYKHTPNTHTQALTQQHNMHVLDPGRQVPELAFCNSGKSFPRRGAPELRVRTVHLPQQQQTLGLNLSHPSRAPGVPQQLEGCARTLRPGGSFVQRRLPTEGANCTGSRGSEGTCRPRAAREPWNLPLCSRENPPDSGSAGCQRWPGKCLLLPTLLKKPTMPSECPKAQESLLIFLPSSISGSTHSVNQPCGWGPAPDTWLSAKEGGFSKVRVDPGGRQRPLGEGRATSCHGVSCCWIISQ